MDDKNDPKYGPLLSSLDFWKGIELDKLDDSATQIAEAQEISLSERKKLAEETKKWNKLTQEEKMTTMAGLLKCYQKEVDRLTSRAKQGEQAFLQVFQTLSSAPNFEASLSLAKELTKEVAEKSSIISKQEIQISKLKHEVDGYKSDFQELKSQDVLVRKQEEIIARYEQDMNRLVSEGISDAEKKIETSFAIEIEKRDQLVSQLKSELKHVSDLHSSALKERDIAQNQINNVETRFQRDLAAKQSQLDLLTSENDILTQKIATLEHLKNSSDESNQKDSKSMNNNNDNDDIEKDLQIAQLSQDLHDLSVRFEGQRQVHQFESAQLETQLSTLRDQIKEYETKMTDLPTLEEWKATKDKLSMLSGLQFYLGASENEIEEASQMRAEAANVLIKEKIRKLERNNLELKTTTKNLEKEILELKAKNASLQQQQKEDIENTMNIEVFGNLDQMNAIGSEKEQNLEQNPESVKSMIQVLATQRDRFKARKEQLEIERDRLNQQFREATAKSQSLYEDNIKLYEKIKYLQSFGTHQQASSSTQTSNSNRSSASAAIPELIPNMMPNQGSKWRNVAFDGNSSSSHTDIESGSNVEEKYKSVYEETVNPFAAFSDRERTKRFDDLNHAERIVWRLTNFFLASKKTRMVLFGYLLIVHIFVFITTYKTTTFNSRCNERLE